MLLLHKKLGETPLECLNRQRGESDLYKDVPMTYAGRLDPMAEGLLICLIGDECKNKERYLDLDKEYIFEILIGFSTDTHDLLGLIRSDINNGNFSENDLRANKDSVFKVIPSFIGKRKQNYPAFSSKTLNGKALHTLSREGILNESNIPSKEIEIFQLDVMGESILEQEVLLKDILYRISLVIGDFRQNEIKECWTKHLSKSGNLIMNYYLLKVKMTCSSGTYVRALVRDISKLTDIPMCVYSIVRTRIGSYTSIINDGA